MSLNAAPPLVQPPPASVARAARRLMIGRGAVVGVALAIATLLAFAPVVRNEFIVYDDGSYLVRNPRVQQGFDLPALRWAFTSLEHANWHPLTWLSHMLDYQLFGPWAGGHHAVSALIHTANACLLFAVLRCMTGAFWRSALLAALFALHPLRVESVAWASERKDVLSLFFGLGALACYLRSVRGRSRGAAAAAFALFACSLMSKAMLVTFPALLLLLDFWPLDRWTRARAGASFPGPRLLLEKLPFLALSVAAGVLALLAHGRVGAVAYADEFPLGPRIGNASYASAAYLGKMVWPAKLAVIYPYAWEDLSWWQPALAAALTAAVTVAALLLLRRRPVFLVGWAWYLGTLLPVIGLKQVGSQSMADRYTLLPGIGILLLVAWGLGWVAGRRTPARTAILVAVPLILAALAVATRAQVVRWRTSETLFRHTVQVTRYNTAALANLGIALWEQGRMEEGNVFIRESSRASPVNRAMVFKSSGDYFAARGMPREAAEQYRKALEIRPYDRFVREKLRALGAAAGSPAP